LNSKPVAETASHLDRSRMPSHVAVIMDGNGRWAKKRLMNRIKGHEQGVKSVRTIVSVCRELEIPILTLYAFSTENWKRSKIEVASLMMLLKKFLESEKEELMEKEIRLRMIGQMDRLPEDVQATLKSVMETTKKNGIMTLNLALSYGGRTEITDMVIRIAGKVRTGTIDPEQITAELIEDHLYTSGLSDPDILIRTSGEMRISNFLLWQIAYSEIFVTDTLWPDFGRDEFIEILKQFQSRERRFGNVLS